MPGQQLAIALTDMPDAKRIDEPVQRDCSPCVDGGEKVIGAGIAISHPDLSAFAETEHPAPEA